MKKKFCFLYKKKADIFLMICVHISCSGFFVIFIGSDLFYLTQSLRMNRKTKKLELVKKSPKLNNKENIIKHKI